MTKSALVYRVGVDTVRGEAFRLRVDTEPRMLEYPERGTQIAHGTIDNWGRAIVQSGDGGHLRTFQLIPCSEHNRIDYGQFFVDGWFLVIRVNNAREARQSWELFAQQPAMSSTLDRDRAWTLEQVIADNKHLQVWSARFELAQDRLPDAYKALLLVGGVTRAEKDGTTGHLVVEFNPLAAKGVTTAALACGGILMQRVPHEPSEPRIDFEPAARQVYDTFLVAMPNVAVEGLFRLGSTFFIASPSKDQLIDGTQTVEQWFNKKLKPAGAPIRMAVSRPDGSIELAHRTRQELLDGYGIMRTSQDISRELALLLPSGFPLAAITEGNLTLDVGVTRELEAAELRRLESLAERIGLAVPLVTTIREPVTPAPPEKRANRPMTIAAIRHHSGALPQVVARTLEEDESFWRENYQGVFRGDVALDGALKRPRYSSGDACLVGTTFQPSNLRAYLSLYSSVVLVMPLEERLEDMLSALGVGRRQLVELVARGTVSFVAPQSIERYSASFFAEVLDANGGAVLCTRRLASAAYIDQLQRNPLFLFPGTSLERRVVLRCLARMEKQLPREAGDTIRAVRQGLSEAWNNFEWALQVRGAMASVGGPLAFVARALARSITGKDYFVELGGAAPPIEWAGALGAHFAPFAAEDYSEEGHSALLIALHSGTQRDARALARATQFSVAEELLVIDNDVDVLDFVLELGTGDLARFRKLVRGIARPERTAEEIAEIVSMWNGQMRAYERRQDRIRSMSLGGVALGVLANTIGTPDLVSISARVMPFIPAALTLLNEEILGEQQALSSVLDTINAGLARVHPDAVLLARMKKLVRGMK